MSNIFDIVDCNKAKFRLKNIHTTKYGTKIVLHTGTKKMEPSAKQMQYFNHHR